MTRVGLILGSPPYRTARRLHSPSRLTTGRARAHWCTPPAAVSRSSDVSTPSPLRPPFSLSPSLPGFLPPVRRRYDRRRPGHNGPRRTPENHDDDHPDPAEARTLSELPDGDRELRRTDPRAAGRHASRPRRMPDLPRPRQPGVSDRGRDPLSPGPPPTDRGYRGVSPLWHDHRRGPGHLSDLRRIRLRRVPRPGLTGLPPADVRAAPPVSRIQAGFGFESAMSDR